MLVVSLNCTLDSISCEGISNLAISLYAAASQPSVLQHMRPDMLGVYVYILVSMLMDGQKDRQTDPGVSWKE